MHLQTNTRWLVLAALGAALAGCGDDPADDTGPVGPGDTDTDVTNPCGAFQLVGGDLPAALLSITGTSASDVYAVGGDDGSGPLVHHFDGAAWERLDTGTSGDLWWVWHAGDTVWMSGAGARIVKYDVQSGTFTQEVIADPLFTLFGVWGTGPDDVYAVGADVAGNQPGEIFHFDGTSWTSVYTIPPRVEEGGGETLRQPFKVWGTASDDVWVVGTAALITHWDGAAWTDHVAPTPRTSTLFTVHGSGPDDVYAVGGGGNAAVAHWDGAAWTDDSPPPTAVASTFTGVFVDPTLGPVVGSNYGQVWRKGDAGWEQDCRTPATADNFHASWVDPDGGVWAVGGDLISLSRGAISYGGDGSIPPLEGT